MRREIPIITASLIIILGNIFVIQAEEIKIPSPIAEYSFESGFEDSSGNKYNLKSSETFKNFSDDIYIKENNKCFGPITNPKELKGGNCERISSSIKNGMTISFFVKNTGSHNYSLNVLSFGGSEWNDPAISVSVNYGRLSIKVGKKIKPVNSDRIISATGLWHNITVRIPDKKNEFTLFCDGKKILSSPLERLNRYGSLKILPYARKDTSGIMIDEIKIFNCALNNAQIKELSRLKGKKQPEYNPSSSTPAVTIAPSKPFDEVGTKVKPGIYKSESENIDKIYVYSPKWILLANDYMDETEAMIYEHYKNALDSLLKEREALEQGNNINWVKYKTRRRIWENSYIKFSTQHKWMKNSANFAISSPNDSDYRKALHPEKTIVWLNSLGDRIEEKDSVLRGCFKYQKGHYAYLKLPNALKQGASYTVRQKDGRSITFKYDEKSTITPAIKVNQVGYIPSAPAKYAYLGEWVPMHGPVDYSQFKDFKVCNAESGKSVFKGNIVLRAEDKHKYGRKKQDSYSGEDIYEMDFSKFKKPGKYYIKVPGLGRSYDFLIDKNALGEAFYTAARVFFHQRCGCALDKKYTAWPRGACHTDPVGKCSLVGNIGDWEYEDGRNANKTRHIDFQIIQQTGDISKTYNIKGGWHDAADYDRRNSHHFPVWDLLGLYEINSDAFTDKQLNIPESGNGIPDILDEAEWGIDVWKQTQTPEGGVSGRIETIHHPQHKGMPDEDTDTFYISIPNRKSTMLYAASASMFARLVRPFSKKKSDEYLKSAQKAYKWASNSKNSPDGMTLEINLRDRKMGDKKPSPKKIILREDGKEHYMAGAMAAANLYLITKENSYLNDLNSSYGPVLVSYFKSYPLYLNYYIPLYQIAGLNIEGLKPKLKKEAYNEILRFADEAVKNAQKAPYRHSWRPRGRRWGWAISSTFARYIVLAWKLSGNEKYKKWALCNIDFHLGANPLSMSQTTGIGEAYPRSVQDMESRQDGIVESVPGITTYGIIAIPYHTRIYVYSLVAKSILNRDEKETIKFLPEEAYIKNNKTPPVPNIPLWRRFGPHGSYDPLCNEFTVTETSGPVAFVLGAFLKKGWKPSDELKNRKPKSKDELEGFFWTP